MDTISNTHGNNVHTQVSSVLSPYVMELKEDVDIEYSNKDLKTTILKRNAIEDTNIASIQKFSIIDKLKSVAEYPTPHIFAIISSRVYESKQNEEVDKDLNGWEILTDAKNKKNGYVGRAYYNLMKQQVIIAHCGTELNKVFWKDIGADIKGVIFSKNIEQMNSASTFTYHIISALNNLEKIQTNFQLFFTGHSLGGWLAQITTFTAKYLTIVGTEKFFQIKENSLNEEIHLNDYHAHTVVFDSPGCKNMLLNMLDNYFPRCNKNYCSFINSLDITSYLSAPNVVNSYNTHVGKIYRIFVNISDLSDNLSENTNNSFYKKTFEFIKCFENMLGIKWLKEGYQYNLKTHSIQRILNAFDKKTGQVQANKLVEVVDWPICGTLCCSEEYKKFFDWANHLNNYHPEESKVFEVAINEKYGYYPIRYQTKPVNEKECSLNVFTQSEQEFLQKYQWLRDLADFFKPDQYFDKICTGLSSDINDKLGNFQVKGNTVSCDSPKNLQQMIPYTKNLLLLVPDIQKLVKQAFNSSEIREKVYKHESEQFINKPDIKVKNFKDNDVIGLKSFINNNQQQVYQLIANNGNTRISLNRVYNIFLQNGETKKYFKYKDNQHTVLQLKRLLSVNQLMSLKEFLSSKTHHLLILECKLSNVNTKKVGEVFKDLSNILTNKPKIKIILITEEDNLDNFVENLINSSDVRFIKKKDKKLEFNDLTTETQMGLMEKNIFTFQAQKKNFKQLIGISHSDEGWSKLLDEEIISKIIYGKEKEIIIGGIPTRLCNSEAVYTKLCEKIEGKTNTENFVNSLCKILKNNKEKDEYIFVFSIKQDNNTETNLIKYLGIKSKSKKRKQISKSIRDKKVIITGPILDKEFKKLCHIDDYRDKRIYWLEVISKQNFYLQQLYDPKYYLNREFEYKDRIVIKKDLKDELIKNDQATFIFNNVSDTQDFINFLEVSDDNKKQFLENIKIGRIILTPSKNETKFLFQKLNNYDKPVHWLHLKRENVEEGIVERCLVWQRSKGSLEALSKYLDKSTSLFLKEEEFIEKVCNKGAIIIDEPGIGKSTTLTNLSEKRLEFNWVIRMNFRDHQNAIDSLPSENFIIDDVVTFLSKIDDAGLNMPIAKNLLKYKLEHADELESKPLLLLFDGFDEIKDNSGKIKVSSLLKFLKNKSTVLVTSRKHDVKILQNSLSMFDTQIKKFTQEKQQEFLKNFWKVCLNLTLNQDQNESDKTFDTSFKQFSEALFSRIKELVTNDDDTFIGIPLQLRLIGEGFQNSFATFTKDIYADQPPDFSNLNVLNIYQRFIDRKYNIYFKEKTKLAVCLTDVLEGWLKKEATKQHRKLAFKEVFGDKIKDFLGVKSPFLKGDKHGEFKLDNDQLVELFRIGIIQSTGADHFEFIHRTFAEYYIAELLASWLKRTSKHHNTLQVHKFLLTEILLNRDYMVIRNFLNDQLKQNPLPERTLLDFGNQVSELYKTDILFNALHEDNKVILFLILKSLSVDIKVLCDNLSYLQQYMSGIRYSCLIFSQEGHGFYNLLGITFVKNGCYIRARECFKASLKSQTNFYDKLPKSSQISVLKNMAISRYNLGNIYWIEENYKLAIQFYTEAFNNLPFSSVFRKDMINYVLKLLGKSNYLNSYENENEFFSIFTQEEDRHVRNEDTINKVEISITLPNLTNENQIYDIYNLSFYFFVNLSF